MRKLIFVLAAIVGLAATGSADDLYKVTLGSNAEAEWLRAAEVDALVWVGGGYLVLANERASIQIQQSDLTADLIATGISRDQLALDQREDRNRCQKIGCDLSGVRLHPAPTDDSSNLDTFLG